MFIKLILLMQISVISGEFLIDGAEYFIQNDGNHLCLKGNVRDSRDVPDIFTEQGFLTTTKCQDIPDQRWIARIPGPIWDEQWKNKSFELVNAKEHPLHIKTLNVNVTGETTRFWPNLLRSIPIKEPRGLGHFNLIQDSDESSNGTCLCWTSLGSDQRIGLDECSEYPEKKELHWNYFLTYGKIENDTAYWS